MQLQTAIRKRRSVKKFKDKKPDYREILDCIDSTRFAPMAGGFFSLKFLIIDDKDAIREIAELSDQDFIKDAPYVVFLVSDPSVTKKAFPESYEKFLKQQAGAAIQNLLLTVTEKKLSSCWIGHFNEEKLSKRFKIKGNIEALFPIGYEKEKPRTRGVQPSIYNRTYFHEWDNKSIKKPRGIEPFGAFQDSLLKRK
jgi:nitroreductase